MSRVSDFLNEAGVFFMATVDGDRPKLRPLGGLGLGWILPVCVCAVVGFLLDNKKA